MSQNLKFIGEIGKNTNTEIKVNLTIFKFIEEGGIHFIYCPTLDITGYDHTEEGAKKSFQTALEEFLNYSINKGTLVKELKRLGWEIKKSNRRTIKSAMPPMLSEQVRKNSYLESIMNDRDYVKTSTQVSMPAYA